MKPNSLCKLILIIAVCGGVAVVRIHTGRAGSSPAPTPAAAFRQPPAPVISPVIPSQVAFGPGVSSPATARPFFDYFSWQSFVALAWPAAIGPDGNPVRGVPNTTAGVGIGSPGMRVWESYKADWELFRPDGAAPTAWDSWALPAGAGNPCGDSNDEEDRPLVMISKMDSVVDGINQAFSGPLVDQNRNYVRYDIRVNQPFYEKVVSARWYLRNQQGTLNVFPDGVIELKAAWKQLVDGVDDPSRFYTVTAQVVQPGVSPQRCDKVQMGLIGLHIANKVAGFREWVWSTFEHVDNVPEGAPVPGRKYSLNNGTGTPSTMPNGFDHQPTPIPDNSPLPPVNDPARNPVQVGRLVPISAAGQAAPTTGQINAQWQQALAGTVWQNYQLVITQWPTVTNGQNFNPNGNYPAAADTPFPVSKVGNVTMETYLQRSSCIACHFQGANDDFSFLLMRAFKPPTPAPADASFATLLGNSTKARVEGNNTMRKLLSELADVNEENRQAAQAHRRPSPRPGRTRGRARRP